MMMPLTLPASVAAAVAAAATATALVVARHKNGKRKNPFWAQQGSGREETIITAADVAAAALAVC